MDIGALVGRIRSRRDLIWWRLSAVVFLLLAVLVSFTSALVFALFTAALLLKVDSGVPLWAALGLLCFCMVLLVFKKQSAAEAVGNWAYYFLSIAILLQLIGYLKSDPGRSEDAGGPSG